MKGNAPKQGRAAEPRRIRVLMVKPGIDGHWRGAMVVSMALRDAGMEVIYGGNQPPEALVNAAIQEDVDVIGLSLYAAGHLQLVAAVMEGLKVQQAADILVVVGGTIPQADIPRLKALGVAEVFLPGTPLDEIVRYIAEHVPGKTSTQSPSS